MDEIVENVTLKGVYYHNNSGWVSKGTSYYSPYAIYQETRDGTKYQVLYVMNIDIPQEQYISAFSANYRLSAPSTNAASNSVAMHLYKTDPRSGTPTAANTIAYRTSSSVAKGTSVTETKSFNMWSTKSYGPITAYLLVEIYTYGYGTVNYTLNSLSAQSANPDLSIEVSPTSAIAGDSISVISTGRAGQTLNLAFSAKVKATGS